MKWKKGFTLIELLVVIAIIALLLSVVMPSLNMAKKKAASIACLSNVKQLSLGWYMYQEENDGLIMSCSMEQTINGTMISWIGAPTEADGTVLSPNFGAGNPMCRVSPPVTDEDEIRGFERGVLYPYMENPDVYHCPADKLRTGADGTRLFNSYSIPLCLNRTPSSTTADQIRKFTEIKSPSQRYIFVEDGTTWRNWNTRGQFWFVTPATHGDGIWGFSSPVAINHGNSGVFGFADGHAVVQKWHDSIVFDFYKRTEGKPVGTAYGSEIHSLGQYEDFDWLVRGWPLQ